MNPFRRAPVDTAPDTHLRPRKELTPDRIPRRAQALRGLVPPDVLAIAVEIHNTVADPRTGDPYSSGDHSSQCEQAFRAAWTSAQEDAAVTALPHDEAYRHAAGVALAAATDAVEIAARTDGLVIGQWWDPGHHRHAWRGRSDPSGGRGARPDPGAQRRSPTWAYCVGRSVILAGTVVYGLLDLFLLYVPILNLDFDVDSVGDLLRWTIGLVLAAAQALALDQSLARHAHAERVATDLRDGIDDFNAVAHHQLGTTPPTPADLESADRQLRWAQHVLATVAGLTAVMAAWRVAALARQGGLTVAEGALFGGAVGLVLGLLLLVLGAQLCRGNALGDRLGTGAEIVEETDHL